MPIAKATNATSIKLSNAITVSETYDSLWMNRFMLQFSGVGNDGNLTANFSAYSSADNSVAPSSNNKNVVIRNVYAAIAAGDTALGSIMSAISAYCQANIAAQSASQANLGGSTAQSAAKVAS